jgi:hypothetical protein
MYRTVAIALLLDLAKGCYHGFRVLRHKIVIRLI